jgi:arabinogalactan endo-1,4-beta-galactosidase
MAHTEPPIRPCHPLRRREVLAAGLTAAVLPGLGLTAAPARASAGRPLGALSVRGADLGFLLQEEAAGARYRDRGKVKPAERILAEHGANWVRLRIWIDPPAGYSTLQSALTLARRARKAGMKILIDPHYSDFWADPGKQPIPAGWPTTDLPALADRVHAYTRDVVLAFARQGTPIDMIQIGNEVTEGMLWPLGKLYRNDGGTWTTHWQEFATLVKAGLAGTREAAARTGHWPRTMVHIDKGGDNGASVYFFDNLIAQGAQFDVIGESYYPMWHGSMAALKANLNDLATRYGKDIVVVEVQYPWTLQNGDDLANFVWEGTTLPDGDRFPATPVGQAAFYEGLRNVLSAVPGGRGAGFMVWEPEWIPGVGWTTGEGNPNDNMTLFDFTGAALPAVAALRAPH